jgi:hypothetical protein
VVEYTVPRPLGATQSSLSEPQCGQTTRG